MRAAPSPAEGPRAASWRTMISPAGTAGATGGETGVAGAISSWNDTFPKVIESPGASCASASRRPFTWVPFDEPRSLTLTPSAPAVSSAWRREIVGS